MKKEKERAIRQTDRQTDRDRDIKMTKLQIRIIGTGRTNHKRLNHLQNGSLGKNVVLISFKRQFPLSSLINLYYTL